MPDTSVLINYLMLLTCFYLMNYMNLKCCFLALRFHPGVIPLQHKVFFFLKYHYLVLCNFAMQYVWKDFPFPSKYERRTYKVFIVYAQITAWYNKCQGHSVNILEAG